MTRRKLDQSKLVTAGLSRPSLDPRQVAAARLRAAYQFPYFAAAVFAVELRPVTREGTVAVDEHWRLYLDPALVETWTTAELAGLILHNAGHLLRDHAGRARAVGVRPGQQPRWIISGDAEINDDLIPAGVELPGRPTLPADLGCEEHRLAEQYFQAPWSIATDQDCGSGADGLARQWDLGPGNLSPGEATLLRYRTATDTARWAATAPGTVPQDILRWAEELIGSRTNWRTLLAAEIRHGVAITAGMVDYTYSRPSRRAAQAPGVLLPSFARPSAELAIVVDTSASVDEHMLGLAVNEVDSLLRQAGRRRVRFISCDAAAHGVQLIRSARTADLTGGGGTDMGSGIAVAQALRPAADVVVILTDGYTPWPSEAPLPLRVVVGLLPSDKEPPPVPAWARTVRINDA